MTCCVLPVQQQYGSCTTPTFLSFPSYTSQILFPLQDITDALAFQILPANCCVRVCCGLADGQYSVLFPWHVPKRCMSNKRQLGESLCWWRTCALGEALWPHDYWHPPSAVQELHQQHAPGSRRDHWITLQNQSREYMWGLDIILLLLFINTIVYYYYYFFLSLSPWVQETVSRSSELKIFLLYVNTFLCCFAADTCCCFNNYLHFSPFC